MPFEAMESLTAAEEQVRKMRADAAVGAKQRIAEAKENGEKTVAEAVRKAQSEIAEMKRLAEEKAKSDALALAESNENRKAAMKAKAESHADKAVEFIVERIVNG